MAAIAALGLAIASAVALRKYSIEGFVQQGKSMEPGFREGDRFLVEKASPREGKIERGDVVVYRIPGAPEKIVVKRVIGLPGESVEVREGAVFIDGRSLDESPWSVQKDQSSARSQKLGPGEYFVLGDNRDISNDSRRHGPVPADAIVGKYWFRYWRGKPDR